MNGSANARVGTAAADVGHGRIDVFVGGLGFFLQEWSIGRTQHVLVVQPLHQERNPSQTTFDPHGFQLWKTLGHAVHNPVGHVDDVTEAEAQKFTWNIKKSVLTQTHIMEIGGNVPKVYTITSLNSTSLVYKDDFGNITTFTKVP